MVRAFLKLKTLWISVVALLLLSIDCIREEDVTAPVAGIEVMLRNNSTKFPEYCDDTCQSNALVIMMLLDWDGYDIRNSETWYSFILPDAMTGIRVTAIDVKGDIIRRSDIGKFSYESLGNTYAMTGAEFVNQFYPSAEQSIEYTSFMRPSRIEENGYVAVFNYDENFERVKMKITYDNKNFLTRYYLGGCYEIDITEENTCEKLYLGGDYYTAPAVLVKRQTTSDWRRYDIARDHLGSVISVVDADKVLAISALTPGGGYLQLPVSYDPWGRLRDSETLVPYDMGKAPVLALGRGFTGHEHLPMFGLINMNARLYDPLTGRFLSPDPYVQQSESPQNYNRYSYCLNNPLRYTDKDGEFFHIVVGAFIGGKGINPDIFFDNLYW